MFIGCVIYPVGWEEDVVRRVCGASADRYERASCDIKWAYILAIIGIFDVLILAVLAFVLANRWSDTPRHFLNTKHSDVLSTSSKPSVIIQPVSSEVSTRTRTNKDFSL
jgi:hypothetical protein